MFQVRFHGRGGQGVVTAAEVLSIAAFRAGRHAQAFPSFGSERTGAPVAAFCRIDTKPIRSHEPVVEPDAVVVQDPTLLHEVDLFAGLRSGGWVLVNSTRPPAHLGIDGLVDRGVPADHLVAVPATAIARQIRAASLPNAALLGGLAALTGIVSVTGMADVLRLRFPGPVGVANARAAEQAAADVWCHPLEATRA